MNILETNRLRLKELSADDATFIVALVNTPVWLKYIGDRNIKTIEQGKSYLNNGPLKSYKENGFGLWRVDLKETSTPIGMCGLLRRDYLDHPDIGFAFLPEYHEQGFAVEAAVATLSYAKDHLHLPTVAAITLPDNHKSIKLLEKIGMKYVQPVYLPQTNEELWLYRN
jgi:RimJ/RimL family protein N-acetyltransferase